MKTNGSIYHPPVICDSAVIVIHRPAGAGGLFTTRGTYHSGT